MVELADTLDLGSNAARLAGSSPVIRTKKIVNRKIGDFLLSSYDICKIIYVTGVGTLQYIFVHGLGQTAKSWDSVVVAFANEQAHCPNLQALLKQQEVTYEKLYDAFRSYCNSFSEPLNLCGLSLGGILALNYVMDFPDKVNSLALIATQYKMPKNLLKLQNVIFRFMPNSLFADMGFTKNDFISLTSSMADLDFTSHLSAIMCKSLIVCGTKDHANKKAAMQLSQKLSASELVFIENAKHEVNVDNPKVLREELKNFYDKSESIIG